MKTTINCEDNELLTISSNTPRKKIQQTQIQNIIQLVINNFILIFT